MDEEDLGDHVVGEQGNYETDPLTRETGEAIAGAYVTSMASKCAKGL